MEVIGRAKSLRVDTAIRRHREKECFEVGRILWPGEGGVGKLKVGVK